MGQLLMSDPVGWQHRLAKENWPDLSPNGLLVGLYYSLKASLDPDPDEVGAFRYQSDLDGWLDGKVELGALIALREAEREEEGRGKPKRRAAMEGSVSEIESAVAAMRAFNNQK